MTGPNEFNWGAAIDASAAEASGAHAAAAPPSDAPRDAAPHEQAPREETLDADGLRAGDVSFARHFAHWFATEPVFLGEPIDGTIAVARYDHNGISSVTTLGLERVPLPDGARIELLCEVAEEQAAAAEVAVRIAVQRVLGQLGDEPGALDPGDVWINAQPFIASTRIQGIVAVDERWSGRDQVVRNERGEEVGWINEIVMLTTAEAKRLAYDGMMPLLEASAAQPTARFDVLRDDLVDRPTPLPNLACAITRAAVEHGVRWLQRDDDGRFLALNLSESSEYLAEADNFETAPLAHVVAGTPDLRGFAARAEPGEYAMLDGDRWSFGQLAHANS